MSAMTKSALASANATLRSDNEALRATVAALRTELAAKPEAAAVSSSSRPVLYHAFTRAEAFRVRNALAARKCGGHPWAVQPGAHDTYVVF